MLRYVACLALVACSSTTHVAAPTVVEPMQRPVDAVIDVSLTDTIVLFGDHVSAEIDANGDELGVAGTFRVAAGARVLAVKQEEASGTYTCDLDFGGTPFHEDGDFFSQSLALTGRSGPDLVLVAPIRQETEPNTFVEQKVSSSIAGVVGPYVFVSESISFFGCGAAHPINGHVAAVWDVRTGNEVELTPPEGAADTARAALKGRGFEEEDVKLVEARPHFDDAGRLTMSWRFQKNAAYVETDGEGSAYSVSAWVDSDVLPPNLAALAEPPPALAHYLKRHPGPIKGWSRLDGSETAAAY